MIKAYRFVVRGDEASIIDEDETMEMINEEIEDIQFQLKGIYEIGKKILEELHEKKNPVYGIQEENIRFR